MDRLAFRGALAATIVLAYGCGDPIVILGDLPAIVRVVAGIPDSPGADVDSLGTRSQLISPQGLATAPDGKVYVAVRRGRIVAVNSAGRFEVFIDNDFCDDPECLGRPDGIALDGAGGLIIADPLRNRVWRLSLDTRILAPIAGTGEAGIAPDDTPPLAAPLAAPTGVAVDADGVIYFSERQGHRIRTIDPAGRLGTAAGTGVAGSRGDGGPARDAQLSGPAGLTIAAGVLYVADAGNHRVRAVDLDPGTIRAVAGSGIAGFGGDAGGATAAQLRLPVALAVAPGGRTLYIADSGNHRVRAVNLVAGTISTFVGNGSREYNGDLLEAGATALSLPTGVAVSSFNLLYVSDTDHHIVRRTAIGF